MRLLLISVILVLVITSGCANSGPTFNWTDVEFLNDGMTFKEVQKIMGRPHTITKVEDMLEGGSKTQWIWNIAHLQSSRGYKVKTLLITFEGGFATEIIRTTTKN